MDNIGFDIAELFDEHEALAHPIVIHDGSVIVLIRASHGGGSHIFGGSIPVEWSVPDDAMLHLLFTISTAKASILAEQSISEIPLVFPFRHDGGRIKYRLRGGNVIVEELDPVEPSDDWPYSGYPEQFPELEFGTSKPFDLERSEFEFLVDEDIKEISREHVVFVIPPRSDYNVSLWGEMGDAEMVQCVFIFDPASGLVTAENRCS